MNRKHAILLVIIVLILVSVFGISVMSASSSSGGERDASLSVASSVKVAGPEDPSDRRRIQTTLQVIR